MKHTRSKTRKKIRNTHKILKEKHFKNLDLDGKYDDAFYRHVVCVCVLYSSCFGICFCKAVSVQVMDALKAWRGQGVSAKTFLNSAGIRWV